MEIREELPDCHVYIYYMDIRTYGLYETKYYWKSQEEFKVKYIKARIAEVTSDGHKLIVKGEDTLVKRPITIPFDMVVHAIGMDPNVDNKSIAGVFGVELQEHGHIAKGNAYGSLGETSRPGVFVAGAATGPETIDDSIAQGKAAAMAAALPCAIESSMVSGPVAAPATNTPAREVSPSEPYEFPLAMWPCSCSFTPNTPAIDLFSTFGSMPMACTTMSNGMVIGRFTSVSSPLTISFSPLEVTSAILALMYLTLNSSWLFQ
jgi:hypothetical protein